ncbi:hypothetical protein RHORCCE3_1109 [Rickettsia hoogstraalii str. RCCE3]|nr:hypothetical protein RHORCCE3_1109 [Rickettsia hoogstraalii str. RCCE3]
MACAAGIMGTLAAIKVGETCYNYYMETKYPRRRINWRSRI